MLPCHIVHRRRLGWPWMSWALLVSLAGCERATDVSDTSGPTQVEICRRLQAALPEAAAMRPADFDRILQSTELPSLDSFDSHPFSLLLLYADPQAVDASEAVREFNIAHRPDPQQLAAVYRESASQGYFSALQPQRLVSFECSVSGQHAHGTATFALVDRVYVSLQFTAEQQCEQWQVQQLEMPAWGLQSVRQADGRWLAPGGVPQPPPVNLVQLDDHRRWRDSAMLRHLVWGGTVQEQPIAWIGGRQFKVPTDFNASDSAISPIVDALLALRANEPQPVGHAAYTRLVLRVDRDFPCGALRFLLVAGTEAGVKHFSLAAEVASPEAGLQPADPMFRPRRRGFLPGNFVEIPFDPDRASGYARIERLPMYVELRADGEGALATRLLDRKAFDTNEALVAAVVEQLGTAADESAPREIRVHYDNHLRYGELLPVLATLSRHLKSSTDANSEAGTLPHRLEIVTEEAGP